jgi:hypothetical protein
MTDKQLFDYVHELVTRLDNMPKERKLAVYKKMIGGKK